MKRYLMTIALGALALYLVACGSRPAPTPSAQGSAAPSGPAAAAAPTAGDPQAGQALYGQTCTACHG
ncbi:MAG TPA: cytochrome c5 family protein, partial [Candidatus Nitrosotenuis sp.]|nr:cytochrome c5 family protein [Candidatus Nitrosotenuis sp.]